MEMKIAGLFEEAFSDIEKAEIDQTKVEAFKKFQDSVSKLTKIVGKVLDIQLAIQKEKLKRHVCDKNSAEYEEVDERVDKLSKKYYLKSLDARNQYVDVYTKLSDEHEDTALLSDLQYFSLVNTLNLLICGVQ